MLQENAEVAVREMLRNIAVQSRLETGKSILEAEDYLDDGSPIKLRVEIGDDVSVYASE